MQITISFTLSAAGQKADILAGGTGERERALTIDRESSEFARALGLATIGSDGTAKLDLRSSWTSGSPPSWDHLPTALELLDEIDARAAASAAAKQAERDEARAATQAVLDARTTRTVRRYIDPAPGKHAQFDAVEAAWPYSADEVVARSPAAVAWLAELDAINEAGRQATREQIAAEQAEAEKAETDKAAKRLAFRESLGVTDDDEKIYGIEDGALVNVPKWTTHKRGKNWFASISIDPQSPGGLARTFHDKAKGSSYYLLPSLSPGQAIEFGSDYYTGSGRKDPDRWYGYVVRIAPPLAPNGERSYLILHECSTGKAAVKEGAKFASKQAVAT